MTALADVDVGRYRPHIEAALAYAWDTHTYDDVAAMIAAGTAQVWPGPASVIVTEIIETPRKRGLNIFLAGGTMAELRAMLPFVLAWARAQGCQFASLVGRRGWERSFLSRDGWTADHVMMTKDLTA